MEIGADKAKLLKGIAGRVSSDNALFVAMEKGLRGSVEIARGELTAKDWASLVAIGFIIAFAVSAFILTAVLPLPLAVFFAGAVAFVVAFSVYALPLVIAQGKTWALERELPSFISYLLSVYAERRNMHDALLAATYASDYLNLGPELRAAFASYKAGAPPAKAYERLRRTIKSRHANRAFDWVVRCLETGLDVSEPLGMLGHDASSTLELVAEKNSKVGMMTWMISASSGFFYPLFTSLGLIILSAFERLAAFEMYSASEKDFITLVLVGYLFAGVLLDSSYNGQVKFGDFRRGVMVYFPIMMLVAFSVFLISYRSIGAFIGA